jgi:hypothetical protein
LRWKSPEDSQEENQIRPEELARRQIEEKPEDAAPDETFFLTFLDFFNRLFFFFSF